MADKSNSKVVFVGNVPYDQPEQQIIDVFQSVGPVANYRFVVDKDTGLPKGYGFVEYHDADTAASAVRNLNNFELSNRPLRVDFSHETSIGSIASDKPSSSGSISTQLPAGTPPPPNLTTPNAISQTLAAFTPPQMLKILQELKAVVMANPANARELLKSSPQLSYAVIQSMLLMGLVDATAVTKAVDPSQLAAQKQQQAQQYQQRVELTPPPPVITARPQQSQPQQLQQQQLPPAPPAAPAVAPRPFNLPPGMDTQALIKQVMDLTDAQLAALPEAQRTPIEELRERIRKGEF
ncbi:uncharacterized protein V1518DRAFT_418030 [Limtongia smithiae]|uniref:uncharacterized protein n=1 Tax=Limtongia smithiae TaxID=1125753 RepID=UPI0034CDFD73